MARFPRALLIGALVLFAASGADCPQRLWRAPAPPPPPILSATPSWEELVGAINRNSSLVTSLSTSEATLSGREFPNLRATLAVEKPRRFRVRASHALSGPELDLGSSDDYFWMWMRRSQPPATYVSRHDQFAQSALRRLIPIRAEQIVEAFGLVAIDPNSPHEGPSPAGPNRLSLRTTVDGPEGTLTRTAIVDARMGWILEQHLHDARGVLLASVRTGGHQQDLLTGAWLPHTVELSWPQANLDVTITLGRLAVNQPIPPQMWQKPSEPGFPEVDLADPRLISPSPLAPVQPAPSVNASPAAVLPHRNSRRGWNTRTE